MPGRWIGIWAAAPQPTEPPDLPPPPFTRDGLVLADSTLRQTIRVSAGAQQVRLRLSNAFGGTEMRVASVCLALPRGGRAGVSSIEPGTSRALSFAGRPGAVVPAGAQAVSDPIDFPLAAAANMTVTAYLAAGQRAAGGITSHPGSRTTSFLAAGDHVADQRLAGAVPVDHWYLLGALEACSGPATAQLPGGGAVRVRRPAPGLRGRAQRRAPPASRVRRVVDRRVAGLDDAVHGVPRGDRRGGVVGGGEHRGVRPEIAQPAGRPGVADDVPGEGERRDKRHLAAGSICHQHVL